MSAEQPESTKAISVRLDEDILKKLGAHSAVFGVSVSAVIREASEWFVSHQISRPEFPEALKAYHNRVLGQVAILEDFRKAQNT